MPPKTLAEMAEWTETSKMPPKTLAEVREWTDLKETDLNDDPEDPGRGGRMD